MNLIASLGVYLLVFIISTSSRRYSREPGPPSRDPLTSPLVKMATAGRLPPPLRRVSAPLAVLLALLGLSSPVKSDEQVPLVLWTSEG